MATYAVGDIQGCFTTFQALLDRVGFRPHRDRLWVAGDMVNRGPDSLRVLRWMMEHPSAVTAVLGNHDLWLLNVLVGEAEFRKGKDTFDDVMTSPARDDVAQWLRKLPLVHREKNFLMVHGGLLPQWSIEEIEQLSRGFQQEMEKKASARDFLSKVFSKVNRQWVDHSSKNRLATATNIMTRIRVCTTEGDIPFDFSGTPDQAPDGYYPWYLVPGRRSLGPTVLFGHWAALGHRILPGVVALDSGCVWGNSLTAYCLETGAVVQQASLDA